MEAVYVAEDDEMAVGVILQAVDFCLLEIAKIADTENVVFDGKVKGKHLPQGRGIEGRGEHDVVVMLGLKRTPKRGKATSYCTAARIFLMLKR